MKEIKKVERVTIINAIGGGFICMIDDHDDVKFKTAEQLKNWISNLEYPVYISYDVGSVGDERALSNWFDEVNKQSYIDYILPLKKKINRLADDLDTKTKGTYLEAKFKDKYFRVDIGDITPYTVFKTDIDDVSYVPYEYYLQNKKVYDRLQSVLYNMTLAYDNGFINCVIEGEDVEYTCKISPVVDNIKEMIDILNGPDGEINVLLGYYNLDLTTIKESLYSNMPFITEPVEMFTMFSSEDFEEYTAEDAVFNMLVSNASVMLDKHESKELIGGRCLFMAFLVESILTPIQKELEERTVKYLNGDGWE